MERSNNESGYQIDQPQLDYPDFSKVKIVPHTELVRFESWERLDALNRVILPENYSKEMYKAFFDTKTCVALICSLVTAPAELSDNEVHNLVDVAGTDYPKYDVGYIMGIIDRRALNEGDKIGTAETAVHIISFGVLEDARRSGLGTLLLCNLHHVYTTAVYPQIQNVYLEVDTKNPAIDFYIKMGYEIVKTIKNYYPERNADAYVMRRPLFFPIDGLDALVDNSSLAQNSTLIN